MADPLASVVVVSWGSEPRISACLTPLCQETYTTVEVLRVQGQQAGQDRR